MVILRSNQRSYATSGTQEVWHSFPTEAPPESAEELEKSFEGLGGWEEGFGLGGWNGVGLLTAMDEMRLAPGDTTDPHVDDGTEIFTYVYAGALSQQDSTGNSGVINAGEFQCMSSGSHVRHKETNASHKDWAHIFRISVRPAEVGIPCARVQRRFTTALRRNRLCVVASPDGRKGSLLLHQDAVICSTILEYGHHLVQEIAPGRSVWVQVVSGGATLNGAAISRGDGVGITNESSVALIAQETSELLLVDLGPGPVNPWEEG